MANVEISTIALPTERYKRNVVRGRLDLVGEYSKELLILLLQWSYASFYMIFNKVS